MVILFFSNTFNLDCRQIWSLILLVLISKQWKLLYSRIWVFFFEVSSKVWRGVIRDPLEILSLLVHELEPHEFLVACPWVLSQKFVIGGLGIARFFALPNKVISLNLLFRISLTVERDAFPFLIHQEPSYLSLRVGGTADEGKDYRRRSKKKGKNRLLWNIFIAFGFLWLNDSALEGEFLQLIRLKVEQVHVILHCKCTSKEQDL